MYLVGRYSTCSSPSVEAFRRRLDKFWSSQAVRFNYKAQFDLRTNRQLATSYDLDTQAAWPSFSSRLRSLAGVLLSFDVHIS